MKKLLSFLLITLISASLFAEEWYICLGSYKNIDNANARLDVLKENFFPAEIIETVNDNEETFYRVVLSEPFSTKVDAIVRREQIRRLAVVKELKINDLWCWEKPAPVVEEHVMNTLPVSIPTTYDRRYIYITDSDTGIPVDNAVVNIDERWERWTDYEGKASLPEEITDGEHSMVVTRGDEFVPTNSAFTLEAGEIVTTNQIALPKAVDYERIKIVLNWGEYPSDLDSHVFTEGHHIYFSHKDGGGINLDHDDTTSWGPETVTIREPDPNRKYEYYIHNYSYSSNRTGKSLSNSEAKVKVYLNNTYYKTYTITPDKEGIAWHVFDVINGNEIVDVDEIVTEDHHF